MKTAVVEIGFYQLLCPSVAAAAKLVEMLGKTIPAQRKHESGQDVYLPEDPGSPDRGCRIEMRIIDASQILKTPKRVPEQRRLGYTPTLQEEPR